MKNNQKGFTIVESILALALLGVAIVVVMTMSDAFLRSNSALTQRDSAEDLKRVIAMEISDDANCTNLILVPTLGASATLASLNNPKPINSFTVNGANIIGAQPQSGVQVTAMTLQFLGGNQNLAAVSQNLYVAEILISYQLTEKTGGGIKNKKIPLLLKLNGGNIETCSLNPTGAGIATLAGCQSGQFVLGVNAAGTLQCAGFPQTNCQPGQRLVGVNSAGQGICR